MQNLRAILRARLDADPRCHIGAIEEKNGQVHIVFGGFGDVDRVDLIVEGNDIVVVYPEVAGEPIPLPEGTTAPTAYSLPIDPKLYSRDKLVEIATLRTLTVRDGDTKAEIADAINRDAGAIEQN